MTKLQQLLNARLCLADPLRPDGVFGPRTEAAVRQLQGLSVIAVDGIVGKQTWYHLHFERADAGAARTMGNTALAAGNDVSAWSLEQRLAEVLRLTGPLLPREMQAEFSALVNSPQARAVLAGTLALWAASHFFGAGEIIDVILLGVGAVFVGVAIAQVAKELHEFITKTMQADTRADLADAAAHLARAIAIMGIAAFVALLAKTVRRPAQGAGSSGSATTTGQRPPAATSRGTQARPPPEQPPRTTGPGVTHPYGFRTEAQFKQSMTELQQALRESGISDAQVGVRGSAVTGQSSKGGPFREQATRDMAASDVDVFVHSRQLAEKLPPDSRKIPGMIKPDTIMEEMPAVSAWADKWSKTLGREVSPAGFVNPPSGSPIMWGK